ncbi:MAG: diaminopimelate epimerase [Candidatus Reconcilbacillus cellulovorans]|uniref:Diaminopimelate epimerase n=1 Tax=Candidatus Reconcilbacillus cellulovorans TaxID=1906605 RepID=A0A2A6E412_9BACL|nr:MAG: diaminopimelate epimerase [Candidatus Reconcilbacillus cellulovorans]
MKFVKMHGLGNDFVVAAAESPPDRPDELARRICDRRFGVGADGLVFILPSARADVRMRIWNADGSEAEQCGNAVRCVAKYVYERGIRSADELTIETLAGVCKVRLDVTDGRVRRVRVDMGEPVLRGPDIPTLIAGDRIVGETLEAAGRSFRFTAVSMGNPHCVVFVDGLDSVELDIWGPAIERHPLFPNRTNVEFAVVNGRREIEVRVWERGAGPTLACGTGACAVLVAAVLNGYADREATVVLPGGDLLVEWSEADGRVYMSGPATAVFEGEIPDDGKT